MLMLTRFITRFCYTALVMNSITNLMAAMFKGGVQKGIFGYASEMAFSDTSQIGVTESHAGNLISQFESPIVSGHWTICAT